MAISFGRRGTGGSGGSSRVGFVEGRQNSTAITINNHASNFTNPTYTTRSWQLTNKDGGKAEIVFSSLITISNGASTTNVRYSADLQVASYSTLNNSPSNTDFIDIPNLVPSNGNLIFDDLQHYDNEASFYHTISGAIPFDLSVLPSSITDNRYLNFRVRLRVNADGSPTIQATNGYVVLKSFGVGAGSTDINGGDIRDGTITANELGTGSVTRPKIAGDAVDGTKIADNAIGNEHIATNAVQASQIQANAVTEGKIATGAVTENKIGTDAVTQSKIADGAIDTNRLADNSITPAKVAGVTASGNTDKVVAIDSGGGFKLVTQSSGGGGGITTVLPANLEGIESTDTQQFIKTNFDGTGFTHQSAIDPSDLNVGESGDRDRFVKVKSDGTGFETATAGGGSLTSVEPSDLDGVTGGSGDASKFIKTDSTGNEFEAVSNIQPSDINGNIPASKLGLTGGGTDAGKFVKLDSAGTGFNVQGDLTPSDVGFTEGSGIGDQLVGMNTAGTAFEVKSASGSSITLANITGGPLALNKGGTGYAADSLDALRQRLGVGSGAITDPELVRSTDADTQKDNTIHRFDSNTSNRPTGASNGIIARVGNDQWMLDVDDGQQWKREISNTGTGLWSTPVAATLTNLTTESDFRTLAEGGRGWTSSDTWLPSFSDGSKPAKVIVGRNGNYLVCIDRNNFFWAPRPTGGTWAEIPWRWEGTSTIPAGLYYTGGETDERLIPAGEDAVIGGKTNIPNENFVSLLVDHSVSGSTSTFTGYFVDDDSGQTLRSTTNTVGNTTGSWTRILVGSDGLAADAVNAAAIADGAVGADAIDNDIIVEDAGSSEAVFLGIVPSIDDLTFTGYTFKTSLTGFPVGGAYYDSASRTMYVRHQPADTHLQDLFAIDYEVSIEKDASNYIRGVFDTISNFNLPGVGQLTGGVFRAADIDVTGTISNDDSVEIKGHKAVITKTDTIGAVNLANDAVTNAKIADDAVDTAQLADGAVDTDRLADDAVTPVKVGGITTGSGEAGKVVILDSTNGTAFDTIAQSSLGGLSSVEPSNLDGVTGGSGDANKFLQLNSTGNQFNAITSIGGSSITNATIDTAQLANDAVTQAKIDAGAVDTTELASDAVTEAKLADDAVVPANLKNITTGSGLNNKVLGFNAAGTQFMAVEQSSNESSTNAFVYDGRIYNGSNRPGGAFGNTVHYGASERGSGIKITDASEQIISFVGDVDSGTNVASSQSTNGNITYSTRLQARWKSEAESDYGSWTDANIFNNTNVVDSGTLTGSGYNLQKEIRISLNVNVSDISSDIADGDLLQFRMGIQATANAGNQFSSSRLTYDVNVYTISGTLVGGSSGGSSGGGEILEVGYQTTDMGGEGTTLFPPTGAATPLNFNTPAWRVANRATDEMLLGFGGRFDIWWPSNNTPNSTTTALYSIEVRYADDEAMTSNASAWENFRNDYLRNNSAEDSAGETAHNFTPSALIPFQLSELPSGATDGKYVQFRGEIVTYHDNPGRTGARFTDGYIYLMKPGGAAGGGSSTPEDGSITTAKLADDAVTADKLAPGAVDVSDIASIYTQSASTYTATNVAAASLTSGQAWYTQSTGTGTISVNFTSDDSGVNASLATGEVIVLWGSNTKYRMLRITGNTSPASGVRSIAGTIVGGAGTIVANDTLRVLYDSTTAYDGVIKVAPDGTFTTGSVSVPSLGIAGAASDTGDIISVGSNGTFSAVDPANVGMVRATMMLKQEISGSGEVSVATTNTQTNDANNRAPLQTQTGIWTVSGHSTDWLRFNAGGLCYFGAITAQPICADFAVWVRWANGNEAMPSSWTITNSRVAQVDALGTDRLMVVKLYAGGTSNEHVDCAVGSGNKFVKLSQLPAGITDGTRVQFTLAFAYQSPSPTYTARRFFFTADVLDGTNVHANF